MPIAIMRNRKFVESVFQCVGLSLLHATPLLIEDDYNNLNEWLCINQERDLICIMIMRINIPRLSNRREIQDRPSKCAASYVTKVKVLMMASFKVYYFK